jgi:hypothetical protein
VLEGRGLKGHGTEGGDLAGDAVMGKEVGAIGGNLEVEDGIGREEMGDGAANGGVGLEDKEAFVAFAETELFDAAHHAVAFDAAEFADVDLEVAREDGAGESQGDFVAYLVVFCAADDLEDLAVAGVNFADAEAIGVGVLGGLEDLGDDDVGEVRAALVDGLDLDTGEGEEIDEFLGGRGQGDEFAEPGEGDVHGKNRNSKLENG